MKRKPSRIMKIQFGISLATVVLAISIIAGPAEAMFVPSAPQSQMTPLFGRSADMAKIQKVLESKILRQRLADYGLSPEDTLAKINNLSDEQVHLLATNIDAVQAGGMSSSSIIIILLLVIIILILI